MPTLGEDNSMVSNAPELQLATSREQECLMYLKYIVILEGG